VRERQRRHFDAPRFADALQRRAPGGR